MRAFITTQGSAVAFSVMITEASVFRMSGPAPTASVFADSLSMMLRRFVTCWNVPETKAAQGWRWEDPCGRRSLGPGLADACTGLASPRHSWAGNFLSTVQPEKRRPPLGLALREQGWGLGGKGVQGPG